MTSREHDPKQPDPGDVDPGNTGKDPAAGTDGTRDEDERVDEWGEESFPASDPPSQSPGVEK